jgi:hypothetical protein
MANEHDLRRRAEKARDTACHLSRETDRLAAINYANELEAEANALRKKGVLTGLHL